MDKVTKEEFVNYIKTFSPTSIARQRITWSTPIRWNYHNKDNNYELIAYKYESYISDPEEYYIKSL